jgi:hypothetical protein
MKIRWILALALTVVGASACQTRNDKLELDLPAENKATVYGMSETTVMFGVERDLSITAIDGVNTFRGWGKGYPVSAELTPGRHTLTVLYRITDQGSPGPTGEVNVEIEVRGGRSYVSDLVLEDGKWTPTFREVTDEELRAAEERRARIRAEQFEN